MATSCMPCYTPCTVLITYKRIWPATEHRNTRRTHIQHPRAQRAHPPVTFHRVHAEPWRGQRSMRSLWAVLLIVALAVIPSQLAHAGERVGRPACGGRAPYVRGRRLGWGE